MKVLVYSSWCRCLLIRTLTTHTITVSHDEDLVTADAISKGGRSGTIETPDQLLNITLGNPLEQGAENLGRVLKIELSEEMR